MTDRFGLEYFLYEEVIGGNYFLIFFSLHTFYHKVFYITNS